MDTKDIDLTRFIIKKEYKEEVIKGTELSRQVLINDRKSAFESAEKEKEIRGYMHFSLINEDDNEYVFEFRNRIEVDLDDEN